MAVLQNQKSVQKTQEILQPSVTCFFKTWHMLIHYNGCRNNNKKKPTFLIKVSVRTICQNLQIFQWASRIFLLALYIWFIISHFSISRMLRTSMHTGDLKKHFLLDLSYTHIIEPISALFCKSSFAVGVIICQLRLLGSWKLFKKINISI